MGDVRKSGDGRQKGQIQVSRLLFLSWAASSGRVVSVCVCVCVCACRKGAASEELEVCSVKKGGGGGGGKTGRANGKRSSNGAKQQPSIADMFNRE